MTFFIPPVFLFGNNANRFHNNKEEKSEYKTAAETEIKVENWRAKRIAELEEENKKLNIKVASLEGEIKGLNYTIDKLKEENQTLELWLDRKEKLNEKYRKEIAGQETEGHGLFDEIDYRKRECKKLKEENEKLRIDREFEKGNTIFGM